MFQNQVDFETYIASVKVRQYHETGVDVTQSIDPVRPDGSSAVARAAHDEWGAVCDGEADSTDLFVFHHLNHTGGASLTEALVDAVGVESALITPDPNLETGVFDRFKTEFEARENIVLVCDHHQVVPESIIGRRVRRVTMLRHPVVRFLSAYFNFVVKRNLESPVIPSCIKDNKGIEYYIDQIRDLGSWPGGIRPLSYFDHVVNNDGSRSAVDPQFRTGRLVESVFNRFDIVGINELYDESLFVIAHLMRLKVIPRWRARETSGRPRLIEMRVDILERIEELVAPDQALYEEARLRFTTRYGAFGASCCDRFGSLRKPGDTASHGRESVDAWLLHNGISRGDFDCADHGIVR